MDMKLQEMIEKLKIETDYIDDNFADEIEIFLIPLRKELEKYPHAKGAIVECDKKIVQSYSKIKDKYLKEILTPIYILAKQNIEAHQDAA